VKAMDDLLVLWNSIPSFVKYFLKIGIFVAATFLIFRFGNELGKLIYLISR
jgi:hypothetical protein